MKLTFINTILQCSSTCFIKAESPNQSLYLPQVDKYCKTYTGRSVKHTLAGL